jgi:hypothetical protein
MSFKFLIDTLVCGWGLRGFRAPIPTLSHERHGRGFSIPFL